jgi:hypothetical protein
MKRIILSFTLMMTLGVTIALAAPGSKINPGPDVVEMFKKEFAGAEFVKWTVQGEYQKASFVLGGHRAEAYYTITGEYLGSIRDLFYDQLPLAVMKSVDNKYPEADISELTEVATTDGVTYKMLVELKSKKVRLTVDSSGNFVEKTVVK